MYLLSRNAPDLSGPLFSVSWPDCHVEMVHLLQAIPGLRQE